MGGWGDGRERAPTLATRSEDHPGRLHAFYLRIHTNIEPHRSLALCCQGDCGSSTVCVSPRGRRLADSRSKFSESKKPNKLRRKTQQQKPGHLSPHLSRSFKKALFCSDTPPKSHCGGDDLSSLDALVIGPPDTPYDGALLHRVGDSPQLCTPFWHGGRQVLISQEQGTGIWIPD